MPDDSEQRRTSEHYDYEQAFFDFIDASETHDAGIAHFEQRMQAAREALLLQHKGATFVDTGEVDRIENKLDEKWMHYGYIANIAGRIYLDDETDRELLPGEWGGTFYDSSKAPYLFVDSAELMSKGVSIVPVFDKEHNTITDFRVTHLFSYGFDDDTVFLHAVPGELSRHEYEIPTPEEAEIRLKRRWPAEYEKLDQLFLPSIHASLPRRLDYMVRHTQETLQASEEFRDLAELVINCRLDLDHELPYSTTVASGGHFAIYDGEQYDNTDTYDIEDAEAWVEVTTDEEMLLLGHHPSIHLIKATDGSIRPRLAMAVFNRQDSDIPEYINIDPVFIKGFRSIRAVNSLVERVAHGLASQQNYLSQVVESSQDDSVLSVVEPEVHLAVPERMIPLARLEAALDKLIEKTANQQYAYPTLEAALKASKMLVDTFHIEVEPYISEIPQYSLEFSGSGVYLPNVQRAVHGAEDSDNLFVFGLNPEQSYVKLHQDDSFEAPLYALIGDVSTITLDDDTEAYIPSPRLYFNGTSGRYIAQNSTGVDLVNVTANARGFADLSDSVSVKVAALEAYRNLQTRFDEAAWIYKGLRIVADLQKVRGALFRADDVEFKPMKHVEHLSAIDADLKKAVALGKSAEFAIEALEMMLVDRPVWIEGVVVERNAEGTLEYDEAATNRAGCYGQIIDVRNDILGDDIVLAVQSHDENGANTTRYILLKTITGFKF